MANLFSGLFNGANGVFKNILGNEVINSGDLALTFNGGVAVRLGDSYFNYDTASGAFVDQIGMVLNDMDDMFVLFPSQEVVAGDLIKIKSTYYQVLEVSPNSIKAIAYTATTQIVDLVVQKNLLGIGKFYSKVVNVMSLLGGGNGNTNIGSILLIKSLVGDKGKDLGGLSKILPLLLLSGSNGLIGNGNPLFANLVPQTTQTAQTAPVTQTLSTVAQDVTVSPITDSDAQ